MKLKGAITALITPFLGHQLDEEGLTTNLRYQIEQGIHGVLALGTTGESPTLSLEEQESVISIVVEVAKGKIPVLAGTGSNCTLQTIERTKRAKELGVDIAQIVVPYYNKPSQEGLYHHFKTIAQQVDIPLFIYNIPGRGGVNLEPATVIRLAEIPNIIGIKEASGNVNQAGEILAALSTKRPDFALFAGDDILTLPLMALGAVGTISVASNLIPGEIVNLVKALLEGDYEKAQAIHYEWLPLFKLAFIETNPVPIKEAMQFCGLAAGPVRLPPHPLLEENREKLHRFLKEKQLLKTQQNGSTYSRV